MAERLRALNVNGKTLSVEIDSNRMLLSVLRDDLQLTGAKYGCGEGQCGACTVLLDGAAVRSCVTPLRSIGAKQITTIEGLENNGNLHPVQEAFLKNNALQCGYCTSGMIMAATGLLRKNPDPSETEIKQSMNGNLCRCGTYPRIVAAVRMAARNSGGKRNA